MCDIANPFQAFRQPVARNCLQERDRPEDTVRAWDVVHAGLRSGPAFICFGRCCGQIHLPPLLPLAYAETYAEAVLEVPPCPTFAGASSVASAASSTAYVEQLAASCWSLMALTELLASRR